ncbi:hypothetical protein [Methylobacterium sp. R2-1]|uniref:hypothetical protein n=1 Tax=Methylobacterium sp. R2-1 TaxID=2587064 RepID=UPI00161ED8F8|nr:hypothetical protein [Methylobacterium sp. R2-1]MBB2961700.1 hypothetical protein [Methylobacterium sp. R2-1]
MSMASDFVELYKALLETIEKLAYWTDRDRRHAVALINKIVDKLEISRDHLMANSIPTEESHHLDSLLNILKTDLQQFEEVPSLRGAFSKYLPKARALMRKADRIIVGQKIEFPGSDHRYVKEACREIDRAIGELKGAVDALSRPGALVRPLAPPRNSN